MSHCAAAERDFARLGAIVLHSGHSEWRFSAATVTTRRARTALSGMWKKSVSASLNVDLQTAVI